MLTKNNANTIHIKPKKIATILGAFLLLLVLLSLLGQYLRYYTQYEKAFGLIPLVNIARDLSVPTIYEVILLFFAAILLNIISKISKTSKDGFHRLWKALAILFIYFALDHGTGAYKLVYVPISRGVRSLLPAYTSRSWHLTPLLIAIVVYVFRDLYQSLPAKIKRWVLISAALYLTGFVVSKLIAGIYVHLYSRENYLYVILITISRSLEISSVITFIHALLSYFQDKKYLISLKFNNRNQPEKNQGG